MIDILVRTARALSRWVLAIHPGARIPWLLERCSPSDRPRRGAGGAGRAPREPRTRRVAGTSAIAVGVLLAVTGGGCLTSGVYADEEGLSRRHFEGSDQGFLEAVRFSGARALECPADQTTPRKFAPARFLAEGCGRRTQFTAVHYTTDPDVWFVTRDVLATDGVYFEDNAEGWLEAVRASGAHDMGCSSAQVSTRRIARYRSSDEFVADGCGQRAAYKSTASLLLLVSVIRLEPDASPRFMTPLAVTTNSASAAPSAGFDTSAGCTMDVQCKGDRICVRGRCAPPGARDAPPP